MCSQNHFYLVPEQTSSEKFIKIHLLLSKLYYPWTNYQTLAKNITTSAEIKKKKIIYIFDPSE